MNRDAKGKLLTPGTGIEVVASDEHMVICRTPPSLYQPAAVANAHLIAAAPELLDALKAAFGAIAYILTSSTDGRVEFEPHEVRALEDRLSAARAALAKAEGRS